MELIWTGPFEEKVGAGHMHMWHSQCGRYRVHMGRAPKGDAPQFTASYQTKPNHWWSTKSALEGPGYPKRYTSLSAAFDAIVSFHQETTSEVVDRSNAHKMVDEAQESGLLSKIPEPIEDPEEEDVEMADMESEVAEGTETLTVDYNEAVAMLAECGFHNAQNYKKDMAKKLTAITMEDYKEGELTPENETSKALLQKVFDANRDGVKIIVTGYDAKADKKPAKKAEAKAEKADKKPAKKAESSGRGGDNNAKVKACLTKTPKSFATIVKDTGLTRGQVRYTYLDQLVSEGYAVKTKEGWAKAK